MTSKAGYIKAKNDELDWIEIKVVYSSKSTVERMKRQVIHLEEYGQITHLTEDLYLRNMKNSQNSKIRKQLNIKVISTIFEQTLSPGRYTYGK